MQEVVKSVPHLHPKDEYVSPDGEVIWAEKKKAVNDIIVEVLSLGK